MVHNPYITVYHINNIVITYVNNLKKQNNKRDI